MSLLGMGRALAESRMTDTVLITRPSDAEPEIDPVTGLYPDPVTTVYSGPARLKSVSGVVGDVDAAGQKLAAQSLRLDLPVSTSGGVRVNDTATITASVNDSAAVGTVLNVEGVFFQTDATARRLSVEVQS